MKIAPSFLGVFILAIVAEGCETASGIEYKQPKFYAEVNASSATDCCGKCDADRPKCAAYSFKASDMPKGTPCKLLSSPPKLTKPDSDFTSGLASAAPTPGPAPTPPTPPTPPPTPLPPLKKFNGVCYASWETAGSDSFDSVSSDASIAAAAQSGINIVAIVQTFYQDNQNSTTISSSDKKSNSDQGLRRAIANARKNGLRVALKPHVDFLNDEPHWRGEIGPAFGDAEWTSWFASYTTYMEHMAQIAKEEAVDLFVVGTELVTTETHEPEWRAVIARLRDITGSSIPFVYGANWSPGPLQVKWWDALDFIGVDAYYPLATKANSTVAELVAAWGAAPTKTGPHDVLSELKALSTKLKKPLLFAGTLQ
jgi:hypothetical protein